MTVLDKVLPFFQLGLRAIFAFGYDCSADYGKHFFDNSLLITRLSLRRVQRVGKVAHSIDSTFKADSF